MFKQVAAVVAGLIFALTQGVPADAAALVAEQPNSRYIVELVPSARPGVEARALRDRGISVPFVYQRALRGYAAELNPFELARLSANPLVKQIQRDGVVRVNDTQSGATWGLDRVDQRNLPLNGSYNYDANGGSGVTAYIIDTGISANANFGGRLASGYTVIDDGYGSSDCHGHGTHVAGTVGSNTWGVAKQVTLVPVRVLDCGGYGSWSGVIDGIDWVIAQHTTAPAVANMSLGGGAVSSVDTAVENLVADGVTAAVAAGNESDDACYYSPARATNAITVGATNSSDGRAWFSNYGSCLDIFAPGESITSLYLSTSDPWTISGTSMAAPHVAGVAAVLLSQNPTWTPAQVRAQLLADASANKVGDAGTGSPNFLLYNSGQPGGISITSFTPTSGSPGTSVTVTGVGLAAANSVKLNGTSASIVGTPTATSLVFTVPEGSATGPIEISSASSSATSASNFTVTVAGAPTITNVSPRTGYVGLPVVITGTGFNGSTSVSFNGTSATPSSYSETSLTVAVPVGATSGEIILDNGIATVSGGNFNVTQPITPTVTRFTPSSGPVGTTVVITGRDFSAASQVRFNGTAAEVVSQTSTTMTVKVPIGASSGRVSVTNGGVAANSRSSFTVLLPSLTSATPTAVGIGSALVISGRNLSGATGATLNGVELSPFRVISATTIVVGVPAGASSGVLRVQTPGLELVYGVGVTFSGAFVSPTITSFSASPQRGRAQTVAGANLGAARSLTIGGVEVAFTVVSATSIRYTLPMDFTRGAATLVITTDGGNVSRAVTVR